MGAMLLIEDSKVATRYAQRRFQRHRAHGALLRGQVQRRLHGIAAAKPSNRAQKKGRPKPSP